MINHFEKFALPIKFELDLGALEKKYFEFQQRFHPDKAGVSEIENSIAFNQAYEILKNPLARAIHILQLNGIDIEQDGYANKPDFATLEEVLEIQEKIPNLNSAEIATLRKQLNSQIKSLLENAAQKLENKALDEAAQLLIKAKYFNKIVQDLRK